MGLLIWIISCRAGFSDDHSDRVLGDMIPLICFIIIISSVSKNKYSITLSLMFERGNNSVADVFEHLEFSN